MQYNLIESNIDISPQKAKIIAKQYSKLSDLDIENSKIVFKHLLTYFNLHSPENKKLTLQILPAITINNNVTETIDIDNNSSLIVSNTKDIKTDNENTTKHVNIEDYIATLSPHVYHKLYKELAILAQDYLKLLNTFHHDLILTYNATIRLLKDLLKHFSWHDINLVLDIISDIFSLLSVIPVPPLIIIAPIFAVVAVSTRILAQLDYQKIYQWFLNLIHALEKYVKKNLDPMIKRFYHKIF